MKSRAHSTLIGSMIMAICSIGSFISIPVYITPLIHKLGVGVGQTTLIFTFSAVGSLVASLYMGTLVKKFSIKKLVSFGGLLLAIFFMVMGFSDSIYAIYIAAILLGVSTILAGFPTAQTEINWWFVKDTGKMISFLSTAVGIGGMVFPILVAKLITVFGLRIVAVSQGIIAGVIIILVGIFVLSEQPEKYGVKPIGYNETEEIGNKNSVKQSKSTFSVKQIVKTPQFWMIILSIVFINTAVNGFNNNASAFYQSKGIDAVNAALMISITNGCNFIVSPLYGILMDKIGYVKATAIYGLSLAGIFFASTMLYGFGPIVIIAVFMSFKAFNSMMGPIILPKLFGRREAASLVGFTTAAQSVGAMIGSPIAGFIYDASGTYNVWMIIGGIFTTLTVILVSIGSGNKAVESIKSRQEMFYKLDN